MAQKMRVRKRTRSESSMTSGSRTTSAYEALSFKIVECCKDLDSREDAFLPLFTHQVFGDHEKIWGYQNLQIKVFYSSCSLTTYVDYKYAQRFDSPRPDDFITRLKTWLPVDYLFDEKSFKAALKADARFVPFGEIVGNFEKPTIAGPKNDAYVVYYNTFQDPEYISYHQRFQSFIVYFINAASKITFDDPNWSCFTLFKKVKTGCRYKHVSIGFCTVYYFENESVRRCRISQVFILPIYQRKGLGEELLKIVYQFYMNKDDVYDINVEDPNPTFQYVRDCLDLKLCNNIHCLSRANVKHGYTRAVYEAIKKKCKLSKLQAVRVYEMYRLLYIQKGDRFDYESFKTEVEERLDAADNTGLPCSQTTLMSELEYPNETNFKIVIDQYLKAIKKVFDV